MPLFLVNTALLPLALVQTPPWAPVEWKGSTVQPTYTGVTPTFWGSLDRVGGREDFQVWGTPNCGKGEPEQNGRTTHACSVARFRNVTMGVVSGG